jgi:aspartate-semialdehyde dehydrogenase
VQVKISVGVLGATGFIGGEFLRLLEDHPQFELTALAASSRSVGREVRGRVIRACKPPLPCQILFSALDASVASEIEMEFAEAGYLVVSNAKSHRFHPKVPLVIPEVNSHHLSSIEQQPWKGGLVTTPNCVVIPLCTALKPLEETFGIEAVKVVSLQSVSGAGHRGVSALEIMDNVVPFIEGEQAKIETEPLKIMQWEPEKVVISAQCVRVPVTHGHLLCVSVQLKGMPSLESVKHALAETTILYEEKFYPQPRLHRDLEGGMGVHVGQVEACPVMSHRFVVMAHNAVRGAAGNAIKTAEALVQAGNLTGVI